MNFTLFKNIMKHNSEVSEQLTLFTIAPTSEIKTVVHDPYWDEVEIAPQHFGTEDRYEPPDPDDYQTLNDYYCAWAEWRTRVGAQVSRDTLTTTVVARVGAQVALHTKKVAPQHDTHWVEKYWVERSANKYWYYRYCWMVGRKKNRRYIGSVDSISAKQKKSAVEIAIADGRLPVEIEKLIHSWRGTKL